MAFAAFVWSQVSRVRSVADFVDTVLELGFRLSRLMSLDRFWSCGCRVRAADNGGCQFSFWVLRFEG